MDDRELDKRLSGIEQSLTRLEANLFLTAKKVGVPTNPEEDNVRVPTPEGMMTEQEWLEKQRRETKVPVKKEVKRRDD